ncbi:hypothetical protein BD410DRAFT_712773 [Rickenella mellea]|uniref:S-adenosyl-L-methionine-dependent methyltransferase n=1 Tax=Rickenella mellea TaxID=50990 RepID=A0A4Y7QLE7_9AGAM|nr:hypothetical protein BD410DRAFT_712773 [Rickenella mellea]
MNETIVPPTTRLPPISKLHTYPIAELQDAIKYLHVLYLPEVRGSSRMSNRTLPSQNTDNHSSALENIRMDSFERAYAIRWLTALISRVNSEESSFVDSEQLLQDAASLMSICAGAAEVGTFTRVFKFGPSTLGEEVTLQLTDAPLDNDDFSSVGALTWGAACVMAEMIVESPDDFSLPRSLSSAVNVRGRPFRVLELGAGTGLVGLTIADLLNRRGVDFKAILTDFHPSVLTNLRRNVDAAFPATPTPVKVLCLDWSAFPLDFHPDLELCTPFELIIGADIVYEEKHAVWIKECLKKLLAPEAFFHLLIPLRSTHIAESNTVEKDFPHPSDIPTGCGKGLAIAHSEQFKCEAYSDYDPRSRERWTEIEYAYFRIGWISPPDLNPATTNGTEILPQVM